jgi:hypothetical protein
MPVPPRELFAWHDRVGAFERLAPPWETMSITRASGGIRDGGLLHFALHKGPLRLPWHALHSDYIEGVQFVDTQEKGPFARWRHTHKCLPHPTDAGLSILEDHVEYALPLAPMSEWVAGWHVRALLARMFRVRHARMLADLSRHAKYAGREMPRVLIAGASGTIGSALSAFLTTGGYSVKRLVRREAGGENEICWDPASGTLDSHVLDEIDVVINLCGSPILRRWTPAVKRDIRDSRVKATTALSRAIAEHPRVREMSLLSASGVGIYPASRVPLDEHAAIDDAPELLTTSVAKEWEAATSAARDSGARVALLRIGAVLSTRGGLLAGTLMPAKWGVLGPLGTGEQMLSWISCDDVVGAVLHLMHSPQISGPVNLVAPRPSSSREYTRELTRVLRRPMFFRVPSWAVRAILGEIAAEAMRDNAVAPGVLESSGFSFLHPSLEEALRSELGLI